MNLLTWRATVASVCLLIIITNFGRTGGHSADSIPEIAQASTASLNNSAISLEGMARKTGTSVDLSNLNGMNDINQLVTDIKNTSTETGQQFSFLTDDQFKALMDFMNGALGTTSGALNEGLNGILKEYSRTNGVLEKLVNPKHMSILAASTMAGAVLGSTLTTAALKLIAKGLNEAFERIAGIRHRKDIQKNLVRFDDMRRKYEELRTVGSRSMETLAAIAALSGTFDEFAEVAPVQGNLGIMLELTGDALTKTRARLATETDSAQRHNLAKLADDLSQLQTRLTTLRSRLGDFNTVCANAHEAYARASEVQGLLQKARGQLLEIKGAWVDATYDDFALNVDQSFKNARGAGKQRRLERNEERGGNKVENISEDNLKVLEKGILADCRSVAKEYRLNGVHGRKRAEACAEALRSNIALTALFDQPPPGLDAAIERYDLTKRIADFQNLKARAGAREQARVESENFVSKMDVARKQWVPSTEIFEAQMAGMHRFIEQLSADQIKATFVRNALDTQYQRILGFCPAPAGAQ